MHGEFYSCRPSNQLRQRRRLRARHERMIAKDMWRAPGAGGGPLTPEADRDKAIVEASRVGGNAFTVILLGLEDLKRRAPSAFGRIDDPLVYRRAGCEIAERAATAAAELEGVPTELLLGVAAVRGISLEPRRTWPGGLSTMRCRRTPGDELVVCDAVGRFPRKNDSPSEEASPSGRSAPGGPPTPAGVAYKALRPPSKHPTG